MSSDGEREGAERELGVVVLLLFDKVTGVINSIFVLLLLLFLVIVIFDGCYF